MVQFIKNYTDLIQTFNFKTVREYDPFAYVRALLYKDNKT